MGGCVLKTRFSRCSQYFELSKSAKLRHYQPDDFLLALLSAIRRQLRSGDYRSLMAVWDVYADDPEQESPESQETYDDRPPALSSTEQEDSVISYSRSILTVE